VPAAPGTLPGAEAPFDADLARHGGDLLGEDRERIGLLLIVSASAATSPFDFTVRFCFKSPLATAVTDHVTMPRTCSVSSRP